MEPAVRSPAAPPPPVPVAWLQGDVLAEYLRFLELDEEAAPAPQPQPQPTRVPPVAWLQGEVRDEFLRFLEESAAVACPELLEEVERERAPHGSDDDDVGFDGHGDGVVVDDDDGNDYESFVDDDSYYYQSFVDDDDDEEGGFVDDDCCGGYGDDDDDACVMEYRSEDGGVVFTMDTEEDDPVLELLRPHILDLPAFRARAAAAAAGVVQQQQPPLAAFPRQGGWMSSESDDNEMTGDEFPRHDGWMSSELLLLRRIRDLLAAFRERAAATAVVQQQLSLLFPRQDGRMSSDNYDEMTDELPRQDDGWMGSDDGDEMTDD